MPYRAKSTLAHPRFACSEGEILKGCPPDLLAQFIKDKCVEFFGTPEEAMVGFEIEDALSILDRAELIALIKRNGLGPPVIQPMRSWTDEMLRSAIREASPDIAKLHFTDVPE